MEFTSDTSDYQVDNLDSCNTQLYVQQRIIRLKTGKTRKQHPKANTSQYTNGSTIQRFMTNKKTRSDLGQLVEWIGDSNNLVGDFGDATTLLDDLNAAPSDGRYHGRTLEGDVDPDGTLGFAESA